MSLLPNALLVFAIAAVGVVYGVDVFFAVVGRRALAHSSDAAIAEVMGRFHEVADARMPVFGVSGVLATIAFVIVVGWGTAPSLLALVALAGLLIQLGLYLAIAKPINAKMTQAIQKGQILAEIRDLQNRWDRVIIARALAMTLAIVCLAAAGLLK
jgi:Domain of unknown function (DUF1772)